ncbi:MAG: type II toxin-antitoxin system Phd/YefM family antitoxin [Solirubrobacterales bacterium]
MVVGVRELRQNLSKYLARVKDGESLRVTERGREVAILVPSGVQVEPYLSLAALRGASVPTSRLEQVAARLSKRVGAAGTTDEFLEESRGRG